MVDFSLSKQQKMLKDEVARVVKDLVSEDVHDIDESGEIPQNVVQKIWELGISISPVPESLGGLGLEASSVENVLAIEELAYGDASVAIAALMPSLFIFPVLEMGTPAQQEKFLPAACTEKYPDVTIAFNEPSVGFDPIRLQTKAMRENGSWVLTGTKSMVLNASGASCILVSASTDQGNRLFIVEKDAQGLSVGEREKHMGFCPLEAYTVTLDNCRVPQENCLEGGENGDFEKFLARTRTAAAALGAGVARSSYEFARDYAKSRKQFGEPIAHRQSVAFMIAEMAYETDALRFMAWKAASRLDADKNATREAYLAKLYAEEMTMRIADQAVQVLGGHGYIRDYPVERYYRNARGIAGFEALAIA